MPPRPLKPSTVATRQDHIRWLASAAVASGVPIAEITSLASLVTPATRAREALRFLFTRADSKPSAAGMHVAEAALMVARYIARLPEAAIKQLRTWAKPVTLTYRGMTEANTRLMREALDPERDAALLAAPYALLQAAYELLPARPLQAASLAMRALGIGLLTRAPLRLANIFMLRLDRHLHRPDPARARITAIYIPAEDAKTPRPIEMAVSAELSDLFNAWISDFRPIIAAPGCGYVLPGHAGGDVPITPQAFREAIKDATHRCAGVRLSPHRFRHLAAHRYLAENPGHYEVVRQFLGHASIDTTVRHYAGTEQVAAVRLLDEVILRGGRHRPRRKGANFARTGSGSKAPDRGRRKGR